MSDFNISLPILISLTGSSDNEILIRIEEQAGGEEAQQVVIQKVRDALVTLREGEFILDPTVLPSAQGTRKELALAEAHLLERLTVMQTLHSSIEPGHAQVSSDIDLALPEAGKLA